MGNDCLTGCGRIARYRGLCKKCYKMLWAQVSKGETTWEKLAAAGKALPQSKDKEGKARKVW